MKQVLVRIADNADSSISSTSRSTIAECPPRKPAIMEHCTPILLHNETAPETASLQYRESPQHIQHTLRNLVCKGQIFPVCADAFMYICVPAFSCAGRQNHSERFCQSMEISPIGRGVRQCTIQEDIVLRDK